MGKEKKREDLSYNDYAQNIWKYINQEHQEILLKSIKENIKEKDLKEFCMRLEKTRSLPKASTGSLFEYVCFVEPNLPWRKIKNCLKEFNINDDNVQFVILSLKPTYIEDIIGENPFIETFSKLDKELCDSFNREIKKLSPLVKRLQNLIDEKESYKKFLPIHLTVWAIQREIDVYRAIIKIKREKDKKYMSSYDIDKDLTKSPQKHKYWNTVVSRAIKRLNTFCHTDNCEKRCRKSHIKAYIKVAELLKILYPTIWTEDINTITYRIKSKDQRQLP